MINFCIKRRGLESVALALVFLITACASTKQQVSDTTSASKPDTSKKQLDRESIKKMTGCYEVTFEYAETFAGQEDYSFHDNYKTKAPAEWIFVDKETDDRIVIQHILVAGEGRLIKHWRQDWVYENRDIYSYHADGQWTYKKLPKEQVDGQWTQKVYQVDDGPRYEATATWIHEDGKHYWESTADAPLPRRERTKRDDYNVMVRQNRHAIKDYGWLHELDTKKIIRKDGKDKVLVEEKGYNTYRDIDESNCKPAQKWWNKNKEYWRLVRSVWREIYNQHEDLQFKQTVDGKRRWQRIFKLQQEYSGKNDQKIRNKVRNIIELYRGERSDKASSPDRSEDTY
jgi:hypothetical protein